jgi:hypothetical protein
MGWGNVKEAARECGLPVESWRSWERDGRQPRDFIMICSQISRATGCDLSWLAGLPRQNPGLPHQDSNLEPAGYLSNTGHVERILSAGMPDTESVAV